MKKKHIIILSDEHPEQDQFVAWLIKRGHSARVDNSSGNYVDGWWTALCEKKQAILNDLWDQYCLDHNEEGL